MAFRKIPINPYSSPLSTSSSFGEVSVKSQPDNKGRIVSVTAHSTSRELSKRTLDADVFTSKNILETGQYINSPVSYAPSDPDNIERSVERGFTNYISNNPINND